MKSLVIVCLLVSLTLGSTNPKISINVDTSFISGDQNAYALNCKGAVGQINYQVDGLPTGAYLQANLIILSPSTAAANYVVRIRATDETGNYAERLINLTVIDQISGFSQGPSNSVNGGSNSGAGGLPNSLFPSSPSFNPAGSSPAVSLNPSISNPSSPSTPTKLDNLIGKFSSALTDPAPAYSYPDNRYPDANLPTGGNPNSFNPQLNGIKNGQAVPTAANRNTISPDDVSLKAASERHQNAIKAITNLLSIIDQGRANKNKAQQDINRLSLELQNSRNAQRQAQNNIVGNQNKIQQIVSAIDGINSGGQNLEDQVNKLSQEKQSISLRNQ